MFYVSQIRDGKYRLVAGPFSSQLEAEQAVETTRKKVCAADPWSDFDAFGVCRKENGRTTNEN